MEEKQQHKMKEQEIYYHYLREDIIKYLRQVGAIKGLINLLALLYSVAEDISKEEKDKLVTEKED